MERQIIEVQSFIDRLDAIEKTVAELRTALTHPPVPPSVQKAVAEVSEVAGVVTGRMEPSTASNSPGASKK
jgi:hypothetical protein